MKKINIFIFCLMALIYMAKAQPVDCTDYLTYDAATQTITGFHYLAGVSPEDIIIPAAIEVSPGVFSTILRIGTGAFSGGGLNSVAFDPASAITTIGNSAFMSNPLGGGIVLPATVNSLGTGVFNTCNMLTAIDLSHLPITTLPSNTFNGCSKLVNVTLPDGLLTIGSSAFYSCAALGYIKIPASVTAINGESTFYTVTTACTIDLTDHQPGALSGSPWIGYNATLLWHPDGNNNTSDFIFNKTTGKIYGLKHALAYPNNSQDIVIPATIDGIPVTGLGDGAFGSLPHRLWLRSVDSTPH